MTDVHLHQLVHADVGCVPRPARLADAPPAALAPAGRIRYIDAVVVEVTPETVALNNPSFTLDVPVEVSRERVGDDGAVRPQYASNGEPIWVY